MREPSTCKLLVMDDEPALLRLMKSYLVRLGYQVDACLEGQEAWRLFEANPRSYDLFLVDMSINDLPVEDLLPTIPALNPNIRVLICSGAPFEVQTLPKRVQPSFSFLQKPFVPKMLADAVAECLNGEPAACSNA